MKTFWLLPSCRVTVASRVLYFTFTIISLELITSLGMGHTHIDSGQSDCSKELATGELFTVI